MTDQTHADARLLSPDVLALLLPEPAWPGDGLATSESEFYAGDEGAPRCDIGLWQAEPGQEETTEADEVFLVLVMCDLTNPDRRMVGA